MELPEVPQCEECSKLLGNTTRVIMCTISPDPLIKSYGEKSPHEQYKYLNKHMQYLLCDLEKQYEKFVYGIHYELNKDRNLHIHMLAALAEDEVDYDIHCATISKHFHKIFGRKGNRSMTAAHCVWVDKDKYTKYVNKENVFYPFHPQKQLFIGR